MDKRSCCPECYFEGSCLYAVDKVVIACVHYVSGAGHYPVEDMICPNCVKYPCTCGMCQKEAQDDD